MHSFEKGPYPLTHETPKPMGKLSKIFTQSLFNLAKLYALIGEKH
jgi:hypothetical protein